MTRPVVHYWRRVTARRHVTGCGMPIAAARAHCLLPEGHDATMVLELMNCPRCWDWVFATGAVRRAPSAQVGTA